MNHWQWWWALSVLVIIVGLEGYMVVGAIQALLYKRAASKSEDSP